MADVAMKLETGILTAHGFRIKNASISPTMISYPYLISRCRRDYGLCSLPGTESHISSLRWRNPFLD